MTQASTRGRIASVQMLRFLAAFAVLLGHVEIFTYHTGQYLGITLNRPPLISHSAFGVDLFFAISGFVMIISSERLFGSADGRRTFLLRRLLRIVPLYWLALAFMVLWGWRFGPSADTATATSAFAFLPHASNIAHGRMVPPLEVGWTLNYEMLFYVLFALCLAATAQATARRIAVLLGTMVLIGTATPLPRPLAYWSDPIVIEFLGGIAIALLYRKGLCLPSLMRLAMLAVAILLVLAPLQDVPGSQGGLPRLLAWGVAGWLVLAAAVLGPLRLPLEQWWNRGGDVSYALYLVHMPLLTVVQFVWRHFRWAYGPVEATAFALSTTLASVVLAALVHRWIERPMLAARSRFTKPHPIST
jgi:peptidoglycan/LPS O-acetylase OafA/YrhL